MNNAANCILIETICNGSSPSRTNKRMKKKEPPQSMDTSNKTIKSLVFM